MHLNPRHPIALAAALFLSLAAGRVLASEENLLEGLTPTRVVEVDNTDRIADGVAALEGDAWDTDRSARFTSPHGFVEYDLGSVQPIACALIEGDNNDVYQLLGSLDGQSWTPLFTAGPVNGGGMRTRHSKVDGRARYVRLTATGGDSLYAVAEAGLYSTCPTTWPPQLARAHGKSLEEIARERLTLFAAALLLFLLVHRRGNRRLNLTALLPLGFAVSLLSTLYKLFPLFPIETTLRGTIATLAAAVLLREAFSPETHQPERKLVNLTLGFLALAAFGCYFHFGAPQFHDDAKNRATLVHPFDMRHYFPLAKYFNELHFDGLYDASLAAYVELTPGMTLEKAGNLKLRDLSSAEMRHASELTGQIEAVRARFTPERWREFKKDMSYFLQSMGPGAYLGTMTDHGGNATPVWILSAYILFAHAPANELTLTLTGLIDPLLLLLLFYTIYICFGARVALYTIIVFGATDFYQFGTNMFGSTLRQDWLVATGLGACAIRRKRPLLGGALLAYAGLIRAFPAVAVLMLPVPIFWWLLDSLRSGLSTNRESRLKQLLSTQRESLRAIAGALLALAILMFATSALFGLQASWGNWLKKIAVHATGPSINSVGLRAAVMFEPSHIAQKVIRNDLPEPWEDWQRYQNAAFERRRLLFYFANLTMIILVLLAARRRPLEQAALLGLLLIPFFFYPSNYYCHYIFLLPMAAAGARIAEAKDKGFALAVLSLLAVCISQWLTADVGWSDVRYAVQSFELIAGSLLFVLALIWVRPAGSEAETSAPLAAG